jgi:hypothetical protein
MSSVRGKIIINFFLDSSKTKFMILNNKNRVLLDRSFFRFENIFIEVENDL